MERAARVIGKQNLRRKDLSDEQLAIAAWPVAVGKRLAERTKPVRMVRDHLVIEVEDAVWQRQLFTLRSQIMQQMEKAVGRKLVVGLEFCIAIKRRQAASAATADVAQSDFIDEADGIADPFLRSIYKSARRKASA